MSVKVIENRRLQHRKLLEIGMIVSLALHIIILQSSKQIKTNPVEIQLPPPDFIPPEIPNIEPTKPFIPPKPPTIPTVSEDPLLPEDELIEIPHLKWTDPLPPPDWSESSGADEWLPPFVAREVDPDPIGGFAEIANHIAYPELARRAGIEGRVIVAVEIDENGEVLQTRVTKSLNFAGMDEAAEKAIRAVKWTPAYQRDKPGFP